MEPGLPGSPDVLILSPGSEVEISLTLSQHSEFRVSLDDRGGTSYRNTALF